LIALTCGSRVGVDVEFARPLPERQKIADEFFSAAERRCIQEARENANEVFYQLWTAKEAYLKAVGLGIGAIKEAEFAMETAANDKLRLYKGITTEGRWYVHLLQPVPSYIGCLVSESAARVVEFVMAFPDIQTRGPAG
jgi:4'-phosphopantetheinyl transferase